MVASKQNYDGCRDRGQIQMVAASSGAGVLTTDTPPKRTIINTNILVAADGCYIYLFT